MTNHARAWHNMPDHLTEGCSVSVLRRGSRMCIDVVHLDGDAEVSMIGPSESEAQLLEHALRRIREYIRPGRRDGS